LTVLLATAVLLTLVSDSIPSTSITTSVLCKYYWVLNVLCKYYWALNVICKYYWVLNVLCKYYWVLNVLCKYFWVLDLMSVNQHFLNAAIS
jgi:hypothetical protein